VFLARCDNGVAFPSGELHSFLGFLPGLSELVVDTGLIMLQIQKYGQSFAMSLLFAYVADQQPDYYVIIVMAITVLFFWCYLLLLNSHFGDTDFS
jgi:hypothetical protein